MVVPPGLVIGSELETLAPLPRCPAASAGLVGWRPLSALTSSPFSMSHSLFSLVVLYHDVTIKKSGGGARLGHWATPHVKVLKVLKILKGKKGQIVFKKTRRLLLEKVAIYAGLRVGLEI